MTLSKLELRQGKQSHFWHIWKEWWIFDCIYMFVLRILKSFKVLKACINLDQQETALPWVKIVMKYKTWIGRCFVYCLDWKFHFIIFCRQSILLHERHDLSCYLRAHLRSIQGKWCVYGMTGSYTECNWTIWWQVFRSLCTYVIWGINSYSWYAEFVF